MTNVYVYTVTDYCTNCEQRVHFGLPQLKGKKLFLVYTLRSGVKNEAVKVDSLSARECTSIVNYAKCIEVFVEYFLKCTVSF